MSKTELEQIFEEILLIKNPSHKERELVKYLQSFTNKVEHTNTRVDNSNFETGSNTGNLYIAPRLIDSSKQTICLCAHLDSVFADEHTAGFVKEGDIYKATNNSILGADNKAGVAILLYLLSRGIMSSSKYNIILFFPTTEELGLMGSEFYNTKEYKTDLVINIDGDQDPFTVTTQSYGHLVFNIKIHGKAAHAGTHYDKGVNAIKTASVLLSKLEFGYLDLNKESVMNISTIKSTNKTNVVPELVFIEGEFRSVKIEEFDRFRESLAELSKSVCKKFGADVEINFKEAEFIYPFKADMELGIVKKICNKIQGYSKETEHEYSEIFMKGTLDSNSFSKIGIPSVTLSRGGENPHSISEFIDINDMLETSSMLENILK